jgi:hypothetical protein
MGAFYIDGALQRDPLPCRLPPELVGTIPRAAPVTTRAFDDAFAEMHRVARPLIGQSIKNAARRYRDYPGLLNAIAPDLSRSRPSRIIAVCDHMIEHGPRDRMIGYGGEVRPINLRGARLYARWLRRFSKRPTQKDQ